MGFPAISLAGANQAFVANADTSQWNQVIAKSPVEAAQVVAQTKQPVPVELAEKIDGTIAALTSELADFQRKPTPEGAKALSQYAGKVTAALASIGQQYDIPAATLSRVSEITTAVGNATKPYLEGTANTPPVETTPVDGTQPTSAAAAKANDAILNVSKAFKAFDENTTKETAAALSASVADLKKVVADGKDVLPKPTLANAERIISTSEFMLKERGFGGAEAPAVGSVQVPASGADVVANTKQLVSDLEAKLAAFRKSPSPENRDALANAERGLTQFAVQNKDALPAEAKNAVAAVLNEAKSALGNGQSPEAVQSAATTPVGNGAKLDISDAYKPLFDQGTNLQKVVIGGQAFFRRDNGDAAYLKAPDGSVARFAKSGLGDEALNAVIRQSVAPDSAGARLTFTLNGKSVPLQIANTKDGLVVFKSGTNEILYSGKALTVPREQLGKAVADLLQKQEPFMSYFKQNAQAAPTADQSGVQTRSVAAPSNGTSQSVLSQAAGLASNLESTLEALKASRTPDTINAAKSAGQQLLNFAKANAAALPPEAQSAILTLLKQAQAAINSAN